MERVLRLSVERFILPIMLRYCFRYHGKAQMFSFLPAESIYLFFVGLRADNNYVSIKMKPFVLQIIPADVKLLVQINFL